MAIPHHILTLTEKKEIAKNLRELHFTKPDNFQFSAGQFIQCHIPDQGKIVLRSYSLSSRPGQDDIELCVKLLPEGKASQHFQRMNIGEHLTVQGPLGRFIVTPDDTALSFIATGAGLAPIMGMIQDELVTNLSQKNIRLLFGVRSEEDIFWIDRLNALEEQYPNFRYYLTLSQPSDAWTGLRGRVTDHVQSIDPSHTFYLCGSAEMVKDVRHHLVAQGTPVKNIRFEIF
ncbi:MAG TPA: FAD-binding oxidoreductase [Candidatus Kapabacteria bacterium]|nr:FAD-binding oxidoreductase [Candidatus Kapabacteria bacterium]